MFRDAPAGRWVAFLVLLLPPLVLFWGGFFGGSHNRTPRPVELQRDMAYAVVIGTASASDAELLLQNAATFMAMLRVADPGHPVLALVSAELRSRLGPAFSRLGFELPPLPPDDLPAPLRDIPSASIQRLVLTGRGWEWLAVAALGFTQYDRVVVAPLESLFMGPMTLPLPAEAASQGADAGSVREKEEDEEWDAAFAEMPRVGSSAAAAATAGLLPTGGSGGALGGLAVLRPSAAAMTAASEAFLDKKADTWLCPNNFGDCTESALREAELLKSLLAAARLRVAKKPPLEACGAHMARFLPRPACMWCKPSTVAAAPEASLPPQARRQLSGTAVVTAGNGSVAAGAVMGEPLLGWVPGGACNVLFRLAAWSDAPGFMRLAARWQQYAMHPICTSATPPEVVAWRAETDAKNGSSTGSRAATGIATLKSPQLPPPPPPLRRPQPRELVKVTDEDRKRMEHFWLVNVEYKLLIVGVPKAAFTSLNQLFLRLQGSKGWRDTSPVKVHFHKERGKYWASKLDLEMLTDIMNDPSWTRAIFLRDPAERLLSAYLDKFVMRRGSYGLKLFNEAVPFSGFVELIQPDAPQRFEGKYKATALGLDGWTQAHWRPQAEFFLGKFFPYFNFLCRLDAAAPHAEALLRHVGAWEQHGAFGWAKDKDGPGAFMTSKANGAPHATAAAEHMSTYFTPELREMVARAYTDDYAMMDLWPGGSSLRASGAGGWID